MLFVFVADVLPMESDQSEKRIKIENPSIRNPHVKLSNPKTSLLSGSRPLVPSWDSNDVGKEPIAQSYGGCMSNQPSYHTTPSTNQLLAAITRPPVPLWTPSFSGTVESLAVIPIQAHGSHSQLSDTIKQELRVPCVPVPLRIPVPSNPLSSTQVSSSSSSTNAHFSQSRNSIHTFFCLDGSGSMRKDNRMNESFECIITLLNEQLQDKQTEVRQLYSLVSFKEEAETHFTHEILDSRLIDRVHRIKSKSMKFTNLALHFYFYTWLSLCACLHK